MKLSAYDLACGKVQTETNIFSDIIQKIELYKEHNIYHVREFKYEKNIYNMAYSITSRNRECFLFLNDARKYYNKLKKDLK